MNEQTENYTVPEIIEQSFDFSEYDSEEKESIIQETTEMIMESTMLRLINEADDETQEKFGNLVKSNPSEEEMVRFVTEYFPNFNKVLIDEIKIFQSMGEETTTEK